MYKDLLEQYDLLSNEIQVEKESNLDHLIALLTTNMLSGYEQHINEDYFDTGNKKIRQYEKNMFSLLCLRISVNCQLIQNGCIKNKNQLKTDISNAIEYVKSIEFEAEVNNRVVNDALDIMLTVDPDIEKLLRKNGFLYYIDIEKQNEVSPGLYFLFLSVADYYEKSDREELAYALLEQLCKISRERNTLDLHREIISRVLGRLGDRTPQLSSKLCKIDVEKFEDIIDEYSADFFWFYACSLQQLGYLENAVIYFKKCYAVRLTLYGEDDWLTDVARREYSLIYLTLSQGEKEINFLLEFVDRIEAGAFENIQKDIVRMSEGKTLYPILMLQPRQISLSDYDFYLKIYEKICNMYCDKEEPLLQIRLAKNLRGRFFFEAGEYIQAEVLFVEALAMESPMATSEILNDVQIKINLLMVYYIQNDAEKALPLLSELLEIAINEDETILLEDEYRIYVMLVSISTRLNMELEDSIIEDIKDMLFDTCQDYFNNVPEYKECVRIAMVFVLCSIIFLVHNEYLSEEEHVMYLNVLCNMERNIETFDLDIIQKTNFYFVKGMLAWNLNHRDTELYIKKSISLSEDLRISNATRADVFQMAALYYGKHGQYQEGDYFLEKALDELALVWRPCVCYLNDERLLMILSPTQYQFSSCYAMLRKCVASETAYEKLLQFKGLASLAGRERNRILNRGEVDRQLLDRIKKQQDKIALLEAENIFRDISKEFEQEKQQLRKLEAEFAKNFPEKVKFTNITWEKVQMAIPNNSVVIEYFYCAEGYGRRQFGSKQDISTETCIDIYIIRKVNHNCKLKRIVISNGYEILNDAHEFVAVLQAQSDMSASVRQMNELDDLRYSLFRSLIRPIIPYVENICKLYIAPDNELNNLPFEILYDDGEERLEDKHDVIKIECARDFLFNSIDLSLSESSLIIGNPKYEVREKNMGKTEISLDDREQNRSVRFRRRDIMPLPFSELEMRQIRKYGACQYFSGNEARKNLISSANFYKNIHIATHGYFDLTEHTDALYSSCLLFAGVKNWLQTGEVSEFYGNGILTADEISRMDLRSVNLVVLSSCLSGMNVIYESKGFYGMVSAFAATGVHYVISHLWEANDFSTAVLMDAFYEAYMEKHLEPPAALRKAKNYLKNITIGQLKKRGWFDTAKHLELSQKARAMMEMYENWDDRVKPFRSEVFWGGFSCYRCN